MDSGTSSFSVSFLPLGTLFDELPPNFLYRFQRLAAVSVDVTLFDLHCLEQRTNRPVLWALRFPVEEVG